MAEVKEIIQINITRETKGVSRQGFGTPLFLGNTPAFASGELVRTYTGSDAVLNDFSDTSPEYIAAQRFFGQNPKPTYIKIGFHNTSPSSARFEVTVVDETLYSFNLEESEVSYTSGVGATVEEIVSGLEDAFALASAPGTFTDNLDGTFTVTPDNVANFDITNVSTELTVSYAEGTDSLTDALAKIREQDSDWYFLTAYTHDVEDILEIAAYAETQMLIYGTSYKGSDALDAMDTNDPGSLLQAQNYSQTFIEYAEDPTEYPECAIIGKQSTTEPGSSTWKFKEVTGVTPSNLTTTQSIVLKGTRFDAGKGYNTYEPVGGRVMFAEGRMVNGEFIDIIRFAHWVQARMSERIFMSLMNSQKTPYTTAGFAVIEGHMRAVLNEGVEVGGLADYQVIVPNPRNIDPNSRANRVAEGFEFSGTLQGAIHFIGISGNLTI